MALRMCEGRGSLEEVEAERLILLAGAWVDPHYRLVTPITSPFSFPLSSFPPHPPPSPRREVQDIQR